MVILTRRVDGDVDPSLLPDEDFSQGEDQPTVELIGHHPPPGFAAGMALCIPSLSLIGLLYSLLK